MGEERGWWARPAGLRPLPMGGGGWR